jgi:DNA-directed RNA polymerase subunit beta'
LVYGKDGELIRSYNLPVGAHLMVENGEKIKAGKVKIPRRSSKSGDITEVYQELQSC